MVNHRKPIRTLCVIAGVLLLFDYFYSYNIPVTYDEATSKLMLLNGLGGVFVPADWHFHIFYISQIAALVALALNVRFAKSIFLAVQSVFLFAGLFFGIGISLPIQIFFSTIISYLLGAIVLLIVLSQDAGA